MAVATPYDQPGASIPGLVAGQVDALGLMSRPTLLIPIPSTSAPRSLAGGLGLLAGYSIREANVPSGGLIYQAAASANAAAANNVTLPAVGLGYTTFVTGFEITGDGATAGSIITITLTGVLGGTRTYYLTIPAGVGTAITPLIVNFTSLGLPASAANTPITLNVPSFGAGNTNAAVNILGFTPQQAIPSGGAPGSPSLSADLLDGTDNTGELLANLSLPAYGVVTQAMGQHGPVFTRGLFLNITAGGLRGAVYVKI